MTAFQRFADNMRPLLSQIVASDSLHAKWLNTLSFLENCGARKIAACEHPTLVKEDMLKHAAEEFRHALHLKRQIEKISTGLKDYSLPYLLGGSATLHYLEALDVNTSRYLKASGLTISALREAAYLLVTYAIERRAEELYPLYDEVLRQAKSPVVVKAIVLEEKEHLKEMTEGLKKLSSGFIHADYVCAVESKLCKEWLEAISKQLDEINLHANT